MKENELLLHASWETPLGSMLDMKSLSCVIPSFYSSVLVSSDKGQCGDSLEGLNLEAYIQEPIGVC